MKEKQKIHYSVWKRFVDGIYTCKDIEELLADKKTDRSKDFDEASACLWKTGRPSGVYQLHGRPELLAAGEGPQKGHRLQKSD